MEHVTIDKVCHVKLNNLSESIARDEGMVQLGDGLDVGENHPLAAEISSLRLAVARFQDEAHSSSVKLQRHSLNKSNAQDRVSQLERENDALKSEVAILRANPHPDASPQAHPAVLQVQQLTLSLRRLSDKLSLTEDALLARTTELTHAVGEATKGKLAAESAYELAARTRGREEAGKVREVELEWKVKAAEEAAKMSDLVVNEYADLVRALSSTAGQGPTKHSRSNSISSAIEEDPTTNIGTTNLVESLSQGKLGLQRLLAEFSNETEKLQTELLRLQGDVATAEAKCEAERKSSEQCSVELANARFELQRLKLDDNAAAKMVSRYMKFSQKSTDTLQDAMTALKTRHSAIIATLSAQLYNVSLQLRSSEANVERLRSALDELGADILKETYGRRREVALRIRMVNREEKIREDLERWLLRAEETLERDGEAGLAVSHKMVHSARELLSSLLDGPSSSLSTSSGSLARLILATSAVEEMSKELEVETTKRLHLERLLSHVDQFSSATGEQGTTEGNTNAVADAVEPTVILGMSGPTPPAPEGKDHVPLSLDESSINPDPPLPVGITSFPTQTDETDQHLHVSPSNQSLDQDRTSHANAEESSTTIYDVTQAETEVSSAAEPTEIALLALNHSTQVSAGQDTNEIIADTEPSVTTPSIDQTNHDLTPPPIPEQHVPETPTLKIEDTEELISLPNPSLSVTSNYQSPMSFSSEGTPSDDALPSAEPSLNESIPRAKPRESPSEESDTSPVKLVPPEFVPPPLLNVPEREPHPLLADLVQVGHRYDDLQRAFRDCHLALEALKASMSSTSPPTSASHTGRNDATSPDILQTALERLNDYTEDARVELEIRIADERLMARGFETLLSVPGALSSPSNPSRLLPHESTEGPDSAPTQSEVERQIEAFISGADPAVEKALSNLSRKLDDIQHDIAALKRAVHDPVLSPAVPSTAPVANGGGWSSWIRNGPSLPSSPASGLGSGPGPAPTFGNVMTTPRLRHSPSLNFQGQSGKGYLGGGSKDAFAALGLKVPMPSYVHTPQTPQRSRTVSTMYMLGLGARRPSTSGSFTSPTQHSKKPPPRLSLAGGAETDDNSESGDDDADVE